jgi:phosphoenolpyruvate phosphomutase
MKKWPTDRSGHDCVVNTLPIAGVYDALTAVLAQKAGFPGLWISGFCVSTSLGVKDASILTADAMYRRVAEIIRATPLPLIVDCDEGYGSIQSAVDAATRLESLGVQTICIEDSLFPKANSFQNGAARCLDTPSEFCKKLTAIKTAVPKLKIVSRTESLIAGRPVSEAVNRSTQYAEAGADFILIHSRARTIEQLRVLREAWQQETPMVTIPTCVQDADLTDYQRLGYRMVVFANQAMRAAIPAMEAVLAQLLMSVSPKRELTLASMDEVFDLVDGIGRDPNLLLD